MKYIHLLKDINCYATSDKTQLFKYLMNNKIFTENKLENTKIERVRNIVINHFLDYLFVGSSTCISELTEKLELNYRFENYRHAYILAMLLKDKFPDIKNDKLIKIPLPIFYSEKIVFNMVEYYIKNNV